MCVCVRGGGGGDGGGERRWIIANILPTCVLHADAQYFKDKIFSGREENCYYVMLALL